jgi:branched-chain amino acid transport system permease protein
MNRIVAPSVLTTPGSRGCRLALALKTAVALLLGAVAFREVSSDVVMTLCTQALISAIAATSVGLLVRQVGLVSFGHAAFYGVSAYILAICLQRHALSGELALLAAVLVPAVAAFFLGLVVVRVPGVAFSMLTLAVGQACYEFAMKARAVTAGEDGMSVGLPRQLFGLDIAVFQNPHSMFLVCWVVLVLLILAYAIFVRSRFGRLTAAIRENEERARFIGYKTLVPRALVFSISAGLAALAGALSALYNSFVSPDALHWSLSGSMLLMAVIGGPKILWGPAFGAVVFFLAKDFAGDLTDHWQGALGVVLIVVTLFLPDGLAGACQRIGTSLSQLLNLGSTRVRRKA